MILVGHTEGEFNASDITECQKKCDMNEEFVCNSIMFYPSDPDKNCLLNSESSKSVPEQFVPEDENIDMVYSERCSDSDSSSKLLMCCNQWYRPIIFNGKLLKLRKL